MVLFSNFGKFYHEFWKFYNKFQIQKYSACGVMIFSSQY